jgi:hypothetical protein
MTSPHERQDQQEHAAITGAFDADPVDWVLEWALDDWGQAWLFASQMWEYGLEAPPVPRPDVDAMVDRITPDVLAAYASTASSAAGPPARSATSGPGPGVGANTSTAAWTSPRMSSGRPSSSRRTEGERPSSVPTATSRRSLPAWALRCRGRGPAIPARALLSGDPACSQALCRRGGSPDDRPDSSSGPGLRPGHQGP